MEREPYKVVSPVGKRHLRARRMPSRLSTLEGKTIGEIWNGGFRGDVTFPIIRAMLRDMYPGVKVIPYTEFPLVTVPSLKPATKAETLEAVKAAFLEKRCDAVIVGNGC